MSPLSMEWQQEPDAIRGGVVAAFVAWCGCGWRCSESGMSPKVNRTDAEAMFRLHRERFCPWVDGPPVEVEAARLAAVGGSGTGGDRGAGSVGPEVST